MGRRGKAGQVLLFVLMVVVILSFVLMWSFDLHKIVYVKFLARNGGDSAALAGARWQGLSLNLIGDLNLMHAAALLSGDSRTAGAITNVQARLCFVGPMVGLMAAQQAAKNNRIFTNDDFTDLLREHAREVLEDYGTETGDDGELLFPEPYAGCWQEYGGMLMRIAEDGVAAGPDNAVFYGDYSGDHLLLDVALYEAIAGRNWCWFYNHAPTLLASYRNFNPDPWWDPLPGFSRAPPSNSEILGLGLVPRTTSLASLADFGLVSRVAQERGIPLPGANAGTNVVASWYCYRGDVWGPWDVMRTDGEEPFPLTGPVKQEYDYTGADSAMRIVAETTQVTPGPKGSVISNTITWTAAAKTFGYLPERTVPHAYGLVLPAFHDVRLIPVDASSSPGGGRFDVEWRRHTDSHLPDYMASGPVPDPGCWYCRQLQRWEDEGFRQAGLDWLEANSSRCISRSGPGGGGGGRGGRRRGH